MCKTWKTTGNMEYRKLGESGLEVSRLCFGALTIGPLQANLPVEEGASLVSRALKGGVNFIDTAELYNTYFHIAAALKNCREQVIIATKTYAYTREKAARSLDKALRELKTDYIDIFLLHEQETALTLKGHLPALRYLDEARRRGIIKAVGISCHTVEAVRAAMDYEEIKVIHPIFNIEGLGIRDGTRADMLHAIEEARRRGIGIYVMKPLGGGNLQSRAAEALEYLRGISAIDSIAVGMSNREEVDYALHSFRNEIIPEDLLRQIKLKERNLKFISEECCGCRKCVETCRQGALKWVSDKPVVDRGKCLWCGYCGAACPEFCLRII